MNPEDVETIKANVAKLVAAGAPEQDIHDYIEAAGHPQAVAPHLPTKLEIAKRNASMPHPEDMVPDDPTYAQQALGGIASLARDIPGGEAAMAGSRALVRGQSYGDALSDVRSGMDSAPAPVRWGNRVAGGVIAGAAMPGSNVALQGARYGIAEGLLGADPSTVEDRLHEAAWKAPLDAGLGKIFGEMGPMAVRKLVAKPIDKMSQTLGDAISAFDSGAYGKAEAEAALSAANPTPQIVSDTFNDPDVKPFIDAVRGSSEFKGASPGLILKEAYRQMSERQGRLGNIVANSADYKAGTSLEHREITSAKQKLLNAADAIMPSFRPAVQGHAGLAGERDAFEAARDATSNIVKGKSGGTKNLGTKSPAAFMRSLLGYSPGEAQTATKGLLGELKETPMGYNMNPFKLMGAPKAMIRSGRVAPYLNLLDDRAGKNWPTLLRAAGASSGGLLGY